jgi:hypothetical protein
MIGVTGNLCPNLLWGCDRCWEDLHQFHARPENNLPDVDWDLLEADAAARKHHRQQLAELRSREGEFMHEKLRERQRLAMPLN